MSDDDGAATVLVLALAGVLSAVAGVLVSLGLLVTTRHRADAAADLAALAAAGRADQGQAGACAAAARTAAGGGGRLVWCRLQGSEAVVRVELLPPGRLAALGPATGEARAGRAPAATAPP